MPKKVRAVQITVGQPLEIRSLTLSKGRYRISITEEVVDFKNRVKSALQNLANILQKSGLQIQNIEYSQDNVMPFLIDFQIETEQKNEKG